MTEDNGKASPQVIRNVDVAAAIDRLREEHRIPESTVVGGCLLYVTAAIEAMAAQYEATQRILIKLQEAARSKES